MDSLHIHFPALPDQQRPQPAVTVARLLLRQHQQRFTQLRVSSGRGSYRYHRAVYFQELASIALGELLGHDQRHIQHRALTSSSRFFGSPSPSVQPCQAEIGYHLLQPPVLFLQRPQLLRIADFHPPNFAFQLYRVTVGDPHLTSHFLHWPPCFQLLHRDDLLFASSSSFI